MAIGRVYTSQFNGVAVTAQQDLLAVVAPSDAVVEIMEFHVSQTTEVADAQEEMLSILFKSGQTSTGSGGSSVTPVSILLGDPAFGGTTRANDTTIASGGTIVTHAAWSWNIRVPFDVIFTPETCKVLAPSARATFSLATTPADSITMSGYVVFREIG